MSRVHVCTSAHPFPPGVCVCHLEYLPAAARGISRLDWVPSNPHFFELPHQPALPTHSSCSFLLSNIPWPLKFLLVSRHWELYVLYLFACSREGRGYWHFLIPFSGSGCLLSRECDRKPFSSTVLVLGQHSLDQGNLELMGTQREINALCQL